MHPELELDFFEEPLEPDEPLDLEDPLEREDADESEECDDSDEEDSEDADDSDDVDSEDAEDSADSEDCAEVPEEADAWEEDDSEDEDDSDDVDSEDEDDSEDADPDGADDWEPADAADGDDSMEAEDSENEESELGAMAVSPIRPDNPTFPCASTEEADAASRLAIPGGGSCGASSSFPHEANPGVEGDAVDNPREEAVHLTDLGESIPESPEDRAGEPVSAPAVLRPEASMHVFHCVHPAGFESREQVFEGRLLVSDVVRPVVDDHVERTELGTQSVRKFLPGSVPDPNDDPVLSEVARGVGVYPDDRGVRQEFLPSS